MVSCLPRWINSLFRKRNPEGGVCVCVRWVCGVCGGWGVQVASHKIMIKKKIVFVRLKLTTFMLQHDALPHRNCPRTTGGQKQTNKIFNIAQTEILRTHVNSLGLPQQAGSQGWSSLYSLICVSMLKFDALYVMAIPYKYCNLLHTNAGYVPSMERRRRKIEGCSTFFKYWWEPVGGAIIYLKVIQFLVI